jgi:hypothetical protein
VFGIEVADVLSHLAYQYQIPHFLMVQFRLAALASLALSSWSVASAGTKSYKFQDHLSDVLSPPELKPLSPPALTYIPPIGLGTWLSKGGDVCSSLSIALRMPLIASIGNKRCQMGSGRWISTY